MDPGKEIESKKVVDARRRRMGIEALLRSGFTDDEIYEIACYKVDKKTGQRGLGFANPAAVRAEMYKVYAKWTTEDEERQPYDKSAAIRRLQKHIRVAAADKKWTAVANMEKVLGMIQGTVEQPGGQVQVAATPSRWVGAVMAKITKLAPDKFREIVEEQRRLTEGQPAEPVNVTEDATVIDIPPSE
ncbi:MAG: hypothetical protein U9Q07_04340 [Planctomycetota bacterium]|nr:hypothetical protein [Planctomycetota bacterium]